MKTEKIGDGIKFQRYRRITGYLTGTVDRWNHAKQNELKDRVKHGVRKDGVKGENND